MGIRELGRRRGRKRPREALARGLRRGALQREGEVQVSRVQEVVHLLAGARGAPEEGPRGIGGRDLVRGPAEGGLSMGWRECEDVLELALLKMRRCRTADECRGAAEEVLALVKERKLEES